MTTLKRIFTPNQSVTNTATTQIYIVYVILIGLFWSWSANNSTYFPSPLDLSQRIINLFQYESLGHHLIKSFILSVFSMFLTLILSLTIVYASTIPAFRPIGFIFSKGRFLTLKGISVILLLLLPSGFVFKAVILAFSISVYFVTSMISELLTIEKEKFTHARTLGMSEWRVLYEVVILNKLDRVIDTVRQTNAISWMMIATVESYFIGEGGVGALLEKKGRFLTNLPDIIAIQVVILIVAIFLDQLLAFIKNLLCEWSTIKLERK